MTDSDGHLILIVDDDVDVRTSLRMIMEGNGYRVAEAESAEDGVRQYKASKPDLVIVDLMMESVDAGTGFVKELRLLDNTAPVYLLSSVGDALHQSTAYDDLGLTGVFQKPVDPATLISTLKAQLG